MAHRCQLPGIEEHQYEQQFAEGMGQCAHFGVYPLEPFLRKCIHMHQAQRYEPTAELQRIPV